MTIVKIQYNRSTETPLMKIATTNPLLNAMLKSIVFATSLLLALRAVAAEPNIKPIVDALPTTGHFVKVPAGYMVPYIR